MRANMESVLPVNAAWRIAWLRRTIGATLPSPGLVEGDRGADQRLQRLLVDRLALVEVDGAPRVPLEARVEETRGVLQGRALGEGHLHHVLVRLAGADDPGVLPHGNAPPLPLLDD